MAVASSTVPCQSCTLCCKNQPVFLFPDEDAIGLKAVPDRRFDGKALMRLPMKANGDCEYLGDGACTIYDRRPKVCRGFDCRVHYFLPAARRREVEALFGPHDMEIVRRGRELVEKDRP